MNNTPDHPDFTALALGEHIHGTPARQVLDALRTSVAARQEAEQLRATAAQLSFVLKGQPPQRLDNKRRNAIFNADVDELRERFAAEEREEEAAQFEMAPRAVVRRRPAWIYPSVAAAAVAAAVVVLLQWLPGHSGPGNTPLQTVKGDAAGPVIVSAGKPAASPQRGFMPGVQALPTPAVTPLENAVPRHQETASNPLELEAPTPMTAHAKSQLPPAPVEPEVMPTKPPFRNDLRDYTSPPRVPQKNGR